MPRKKLTGLNPKTYEHPFDRQALNALEGTRGLETLVRKCNEYGLDRLLRAQYTGSYVRVTADSYPDLYGKVTDACEVLDLPKTPDVYIQPDAGINAMTAGVERPILVLSTSAVDALDEAELDFVISHELGHIKSGHVLYYQLGTFLPLIGEIVGAATLGIGSLVSVGLEIALVKWRQLSEFTADRAGLLGCQNATAAIGAMMKLAGLPQKYYGAINTEDFITQARDFVALDENMLDRIAKIISGLGQTHPWTVLRAKEFLRWIDGGEYERVLNGDHPQIAAAPGPAAGSFCTQCGRPLKGMEAFCPGCGTKLLPTSPH
jgi:Zn-dependent protease with chaperone function